MENSMVSRPGGKQRLSPISIRRSGLRCSGGGRATTPQSHLSTPLVSRLSASHSTLTTSHNYPTTGLHHRPDPPSGHLILHPPTPRHPHHHRNRKLPLHPGNLGTRPDGQQRGFSLRIWNYKYLDSDPGTGAVISSTRNMVKPGTLLPSSLSPP
jgi:hypothetical protein